MPLALGLGGVARLQKGLCVRAHRSAFVQPSPRRRIQRDGKVMAPESD